MGVVGVVIAGGRGVRLGLGIPKALVTAGGVSMLDRALGLLRECCDEVVVAAPAALDLPLPDAMRVADAPGFTGPLAGVIGALRARPDREAFVLGVDFPLMQSRTIREILALRSDAMAAVPAPGGVPQPLVAAYGPGAREALAYAAGTDLALTRAVLALGPRIITHDEIAKWEGGVELFLNVNTREDLAEAERRLAANARGASGRRELRVPLSGGSTS